MTASSASLDASISVIDPNTFAELRRIPTGKEPHHLYLTPDEKSLVVANALGDTLTFLDPATGNVQRTLGGMGDPYHLRFSPDMKWFVTAANRLDFVAIYRYVPTDTAAPMQLVKRVPAARTPRMARLISGAPGRKHRMLPSVTVAISPTASASGCAGR